MIHPAFQSTLPTRGSDIYRGCMVIMACVSIHAPHEGERPRAITPAVAIKTFQSTLPTRGSDAMPDCVWRAGALFQSTLPTRGSDASLSCGKLAMTAVSIHAPHEGERRYLPQGSGEGKKVSIHAPHEGERQRKSAFVCSISANLLNIIHCGTVTRAVSRRRIALFRLFSVRRSGVFYVRLCFALKNKGVRG